MFMYDDYFNEFPLIRQTELRNKLKGIQLMELILDVELEIEGVIYPKGTCIRGVLFDDSCVAPINGYYVEIPLERIVNTDE